MAGDIAQFPVTAQMAERLLREAVADSGKIVFTVEYTPKQEWYRLVSYHQVVSCLKSGKVLDTPVKDEHGNWISISYRLCGGSDVYVKTAIEFGQDGMVNKVYVIDVNNRVLL